MTSYITSALPTIEFCLYPGLRYEVIQAFQDDDRSTHPVGETWIFLGYEEIKFTSAYILHAEAPEGRHLKFRMSHRRVVAIDPPTVFDDLHRFLRGPNVDWVNIKSRLSVAATKVVERYKSEFESVPVKSEALLDKIHRLGWYARYARDEYDGEAREEAQKRIDEISLLHREVLTIFQKEPTH